MSREGKAKLGERKLGEGRVLHAFCSKEGPMPPLASPRGGHFQTKRGHSKLFKVIHVFLNIVKYLDP